MSHPIVLLDPPVERRRAGPSYRGKLAGLALLIAAYLALAVGVAAREPRAGVVAALVLGVLAVAAWVPRLSWRGLLVALVIVILFIPIRRYSMPAALPFHLEPYRLFVMFLLAGWALALAADRRVRFLRTGLDGPLMLILLATAASLVVNANRVASLDADVFKALTFFLSFVLSIYLIVSVVRTVAAVELIVKVLVAGGALVALASIVEAGTGFAVFDHVQVVLPFMHPNGEFQPDLTRGARVRAMGSAEHPIALGALLVVLIPLALHLSHRVDRRWYAALALLTMGAMATISRTGLLMLVVVGLVFLVLRPRATRRLWPLIFPLLFLTHIAMPGTLGSIKQSFFPQGGLIAQQKSSAGSMSSAGRLDDVGPSIAQFKKRPLVGYGYGTRITTGPTANARILDDQWLGTLLDIGFVGLLGWIWLFARFVRRCGRRAKANEDDVSWLLAAMAASVLAFAVGMLTFDAFAFTQVTFIVFLLLGLGCVLLRIAGGDLPEPGRPFRDAAGRVARRFSAARMA